MIAIVQAVIAVIAEILRERLGRTKGGQNADKTPQDLRDRWDRHLRDRLRDKS